LNIINRGTHHEIDRPATGSFRTRSAGARHNRLHRFAAGRI
jgi:hypothetical protein